jgi:hypothetical protein
MIFTFNKKHRVSKIQEWLLVSEITHNLQTLISQQYQLKQTLSFTSQFAKQDCKLGKKKKKEREAETNKITHFYSSTFFVLQLNISP